MGKRDDEACSLETHKETAAGSKRCHALTCTKRSHRLRLEVCVCVSVWYHPIYSTRQFAPCFEVTRTYVHVCCANKPGWHTDNRTVT